MLFTYGKAIFLKKKHIYGSVFCEVIRFIRRFRHFHHPFIISAMMVADSLVSSSFTRTV